MRILVIADTHIPRVASDMPQRIYEEIPGVDMVLHAGDIVEGEFLEKLKSLKETRAVCGNMDSLNLQHSLNAREIIQAGRFKIGLTHGHGGQRDIITNVGREFEDVDAIVFGHSHSPVNLVKDGVLFFNPGSPTDTIFTNTNSYGILEISEKKIEGKIVTL